MWHQNADYMTAQVFDLTDKLEQSEAHLGRSGFVMGMDAAESSEDRLTKATKDRYILLVIIVTTAVLQGLHCCNIADCGHMVCNCVRSSNCIKCV